ANSYLNGHLLGHSYSTIEAPINFHVFHAQAAKALRTGDNVLAIEAVRGRGVVAGTDSAVTQQLAYGEVLAAKIVPARFGTEAPSLVLSDQHWRSISSDKPVDHWADPGFNDSSWPQVESLGPIDSNI